MQMQIITDVLLHRNYDSNSNNPACIKSSVKNTEIFLIYINEFDSDSRMLN